VFNPRLPLGSYPLDKGEAGPLLEGLADYFAAAVNGDKRIGEFAKPPNGYHDITNDPAVYHYSRWDVLPPDPYSRGKVMNGALFEIRDAIGETADELVFGALDYSPLRCFTCFADAVRSADNDRYGGAHRGVIDLAFARRGIHPGPPGLSALSAPAWAWRGDEIEVGLQRRCGLGPFRVEWKLEYFDGTSEVLASQADTVRFTVHTDVVVQVTVWDGGNVPYAAIPHRIYTYDPSDPGVRVDGVRIVGPATVEAGRLIDYTYQMTGGRGIPPYTVTWTGVNASVSVTPNGARVLPSPGQSLLRLRYRDSIGQLAGDSLHITSISPLAITAIQGPSTLREGEPAWYRISAASGVPPYRYRWTQRDYGEPVVLGDSSAVQSRQWNRDFVISVTVSDARDSSRTASMSVRATDLLGIRGLDGPSTLRAGEVAQYRVVTAGGAPPLRHRWVQQGPAGSWILGDSAAVASRAVDHDFLLSVQVTDARGHGQSWGRQILVLSPPPPPPPPPPPQPVVREFRVLGSVRRGGSAVEFELPTPDASGVLEVLDASGRIRVSVRLGPAPPATLSLVVPGGLHSGVYFARLRRDDREWKTRFVVLTR
jgi:hypothetical protein